MLRGAVDMTAREAMMFRHVLQIEPPGGAARPRLSALPRTTQNRLVPSANVAADHYDLANTGVNAAETILTPANVATLDVVASGSPPPWMAGSTPSRFCTNVNIMTGANSGFHDVVFVATEHDSLYAIDAQSGQVLWHDSFLTGLAVDGDDDPQHAVNSTGVGSRSASRRRP